MEDSLSRLIGQLSSAPRLLRLKPAVQKYAWGGYEFIPGLLGEPNQARTPHAELWIGAHPVAPALALTEGGAVPLTALFAAAAPALVGRDVADRFKGSLPYLLKVLDVRSMLSIQAHPDARQAQEGFEREERSGLARTAPDRNYRDPNHKPEATVALTDFWVLFGFRPVGAIVETLGAVPELGAVFRAAGVGAPVETEGEAAHDWLRSAYGSVMRLPQEAIDAAMRPLVDRLASARAEGSLERVSADYWAARAAAAFEAADGSVDRGLISIYLLNLLRLRPAEGVFVPAGVLHAYLEGVAVEVMATSDNVLRGGLTPKHVAVEELLRVVRFVSTTPQPVRALAVGTGERVYPTPAPEFRLGRIELDRGAGFAPGPVQGADALLVLEGAVDAVAAGESHGLTRGAAVLAPCGLDYTVHARERAVLVRVSVPPLLR